MELTKFKGQFGDVRVVVENEEPWFCLKDVCESLGLTSKGVAQRLGDGVISNYPIVDSLGREQVASFVNEDGLYDVILESRKPEAKAFRKWVTSEVLPSIRKNGLYATDDLLKKTLDDPDFLINILVKVRDERQARIEAEKIAAEQKEHINELSAAVSEMQVKCDYVEQILNSKEAITVTQLAADYGMSAKAMNKLLAHMKIQRKVNGQWVLYSKYVSYQYVDSKTYSIKDSKGGQHAAVNTLWRQRGRLFLYEELKKIGVLPILERGLDYKLDLDAILNREVEDAQYL
jgi:prophage antirepressor-like protein